MYSICTPDQQKNCCVGEITSLSLQTTSSSNKFILLDIFFIYACRLRLLCKEPEKFVYVFPLCNFILRATASSKSSSCLLVNMLYN